MTWTYHAMRATTRQWLHRELPLSDVRLSPALSGPYSLKARIEPEYGDLIGDDGELVLSEWGTLVFAEASGQIRGGGIVTDTKIVGQELDLTIDGFTAYPADMPITSTLTWGGKTEGTTGAGVDPFDVVRAMWDHLQAQPDGDLGVTYTQNSTPYRLGAWHNARRLDEDGELDDDPKAVQDPPIPIDKVWDSKKGKKPTAAQGKDVYWRYRLPWWDAIDVSQKINELAKQVPFDWREHYAWADSSKEDVVMELHLGYPRLGKRQSNLTFVEGENVTGLVPINRDGSDYYNTVYGFGSGEGSKQLRQSVSHRDGRLRRVKVEGRPEVSNKAALRAIAQDELLRTLHLADITQFVVVDHPNASIGSFDVGDDVLVENRRGWQPTRLWVRITGFDYQPETGEITVKCSRSDRFRYGGA
ncbi:hypothetical protein F4561_002657 [Lipingzhangella halophila]|uniref:Minor tail protein n=1 Tax=Lipingzhangella halophila TaxID=1783352 RepID=A0A7W7RH93_9ACTN|nr:hypothetical protein [Lipingzhangella halophila]MBB4931837.1 hypothetical protein [Lipingzhangella halophila]